MPAPSTFLLVSAVASPGELLLDRLVDNAVQAALSDYSLPPFQPLLVHDFDPRVLGSVELSRLVQRGPLAPVDVPAEGALFLGELIAAGIGTAASPYEIVGPTCGWGTAFGAMLGDPLVQGRDDCPWGDQEARYDKEDIVRMRQLRDGER